MSSSESKARNRNKRDNTSLDEIPSHTIEYERLDLSRKVPRIFKSVINENSTIAIEDLDLYQAELEILLTDATKRLRLLKNESKSIDPKQLKMYEERLKKLKDSNYERYQQNLNSTKKTNIPKADIIENILKSQISPSTLNDNSIPARFWNFTQAYELKAADLNPLEDYLKASIPFHPTNDDNDNTTGEETQIKDDAKELLEIAMQNIQDALPNKNKNKSPKLGPYTQRLISSFVTSDENSMNNETLAELQDFLEHSKPCTQMQANIIEKAVLRDLMQANLANDPKVDNGGEQVNAKCDTLSILERILDAQCSENRKKMKILMLLAKSEVTKKQMQTALKYLQVDIIETYKNILVSKQETGTVAQKDREHFDDILEKKSRIISFMKSLYF